MKRQPSGLHRSPLAQHDQGRFRCRTLGAAAAGAVAAGTSEPASAAIIYDLAANTSTGGTISLNGDASGEIVLRSRGMMFQDLLLDAPAAMMMNPGSTVELSVFSGGPLPSDYLTVFSTGDTVDASLTFSDEGFLMDNNNVHPTWAVGETHFAGFTFDDGGGPLYGWMQLEFDVSGTEFTVMQWAYDDTGVGVEVGAVPEPGTAVLLGLGLAGLGSWARRQKRSTAGREDR